MGPMWKSISASVTGTSHLATDAPCQDYSCAEVVDGPDGQFLIAACADGAGSVSRSELGARVACHEFLQLVKCAVADGEITPSFAREDGLKWYSTIREKLVSEAATIEVPLRELSCTLLGAVIGETFAIFLQIGDGAIVIDAGDAYRTVFWPQSGEYCNETNFLTKPDLKRVLDFAVVEQPISKLAMFTDGLELLILQLDSHSVHAPALEPFFTTIRRTSDVPGLTQALRTFLNSEKVNQKTDDDKTLLLAIRSRNDETCQPDSLTTMDALSDSAKNLDEEEKDMSLRSSATRATWWRRFIRAMFQRPNQKS